MAAAVLLAAPALGAEQNKAGAGQGAISISRADCAAFSSHTPVPGVQYEPGRDAAGRPVAPADLPGGSSFKLPETIQIDIGIEWSQASGTLAPVDPGRAAAENNFNTILTSGVRINDALAVGPLASDPRLLSLGTGGGAEVELRILCDNALVLSVSVLEWWEPTI